MRQIDKEEFERVVIQINELLNADVSKERVKALKRQFRQEKKELEKQEKQERKKEFKDITKNRKIILKIIHDWYIQNGAYNKVKPWEIPRPILDIAFTGYAYGAKRGQIRDITDHKYIISLYDYGVGTYDFELEKVKALADFAQEAAQTKLDKYFNEP